ncbi:MAG: hypothetical protein ACRD88_14375, partial [Terriglobia bacterium]
MLRVLGRLFILWLFVSVPLRAQQCSWLEHAGNPIIKYRDGVSNLAWNDAAVLKDGSQYRMWLAGGDPTSSNPVVKVYEAASGDDVNWTINPTPQVSPTGNPRAWDSHRIETPNVIKVGTTYHMYYSGCTGSCTGQYSIGHATSKDGKKWTKDRNNPIIAFTNDQLHWGYFTAADPAPVYDSVSGTILLYYSTAKRRVGYSGPNPDDLGWMQGIALA